MFDWSALEPSVVFKYFGELVAISRPSKAEEKAMVWLKEWAAEKGYDTAEDATGNLVVRVPGKGSAANSTPVIIQGHVDIVTAESEDAPPEADSAAGKIPVELGEPGDDGFFVAAADGGWVGAPYTTLGADNGIGCAMGMAIADDPNATHPPLELLFTMDEEQGMTGALELDPDALGLTGRHLINLDTEDDDELTIGCAGGMDTSVTLPGVWDSVDGSDLVCLQVLLKDLRGGHSGVEIHSCRANAIRCLARALCDVSGGPVRVADLQGGEKRNAIPRRAAAVIVIPSSLQAELEQVLQAAGDEMTQLYQGRDFPVRFQVSAVDSVARALDADSSSRLLNLIVALPDGVFTMTSEIPDLVETSNNVAVVGVTGDNVIVHCNSRSSVDAGMEDVADAIAACARLAGASTSSSGRYPGWKPNLDSELLKVTQPAYQQLFNEEPKVTAIHAGLECGVLGDKMSGLDSISFGPNIRGNHAPGEHVEVASVAKSYRLLQEVLANLG